MSASGLSLVSVLGYAMALLYKANKNEKAIGIIAKLLMRTIQTTCRHKRFLDSSLSYQLLLFSVSTYNLFQQRGRFMKETKNQWVNWFIKRFLV